MNVRESAVHILMDIEKNNAKSHLALQDEMERNPDMTLQDQRFLRRLVQGTLENQYLLDYRINLKSKVRVNKMKPAIRQIIRTAAFQLFFMDRVPVSAVCNEAVKLTQKYHMQGLKGFVNGVLRSMAREENWPEPDDSVKYSVPRWILDLWQREYGEEALQKMMLSLTEDKKTCFRMRADRWSEDEIRKTLAQDQAVYVKAEFPEDAWKLEHAEGLSGWSSMKQGMIQIQDLSSMLAGTLACIEKGMNILDVCAAPGGKSMHAAEILEGTGHVTSCDLSEQKVRMIRANRERAGLQNMSEQVQDALVYRPEWDQAFDLVIADLPCSGLGVIARKPEIRYHVTRKDVDSLSDLQRQILKNVSRYVKPGGVLMYSTCTVAPEENRGNREWILQNLPFTAEEWNPEILPESLRDRAAGGQLQLFPGTDPCDGFYIARFRRVTAGSSL